MWITKRSLLLLLFLLLFLAPAVGLASEKQLAITETQLDFFDQSFNELVTLIEASKLTTTDSALRIASLEKNLQALSQRLKKASELQITSAQIIAKQAETLTQQEKSLSDSEKLVTKLEKEIQRLKRQNSFGIYGNTTSGGVFVVHDRLMMSAGQKWAGGLEVGAGVIVLTW